MTTKEIIAIIITAVVLTVDLVTDYQLRLKYRNVVKPEGSVRHDRGFLIRTIGIAPAIWLSWYRLTPLLLFAYWHIFDGLTNVLWGNSWGRIGTTSVLDKLQRKYPVIVVLKYFCLFASIIFQFI